jgi:hypothetical protein
MSITIDLPPEAEEKLRRRAVDTGVAPDTLARQLLEQALNGGGQAQPGSRRSAALEESAILPCGPDSATPLPCIACEEDRPVPVEMDYREPLTLLDPDDEPLSSSER